MQQHSDIFSLLQHAQEKGKVLKVKIAHEPMPFVARVEEILERKEVVKFNFDELPCPASQRKSYYFDEIADVESAGFAFNNPLATLLTKMLA